MPKKSSSKTEFAVIATGGKQYKVAVGDVVSIEKLDEKMTSGGTVTFDKVLLVDDGTNTTIGTPYIDGAKVEASFEGNIRAKKVIVMKYKQKSRYHKKNGHRQPLTQIKITAIK